MIRIFRSRRGRPKSDIVREILEETTLWALRTCEAGTNQRAL